jgi:hypothetical protein
MTAEAGCGEGKTNRLPSQDLVEDPLSSRCTPAEQNGHEAVLCTLAML